jgi:hypothetical protein
MSMEQALPIDDYYWSREEVIARMQSGEPAATAEEYLLRVRCGDTASLIAAYFYATVLFSNP